MTGLDYLVSRRGLDPAAETCAWALTDLLHADVRGVRRGELWRFELEGALDVDTAQRRLETAASRAGRYVNRNRDVGVWLAGPRPYPPDGPAGCTAVDVWVQEGDGRDAAALAWFRAQGPVPLGDLQRGVLWRLFLPGRDAPAAREWASELAVTRARAHGLLSNPHAQTSQVLYTVASD